MILASARFIVTYHKASTPEPVEIRVVPSKGRGKDRVVVATLVSEREFPVDELFPAAWEIARFIYDGHCTQSEVDVIKETLCLMRVGQWQR